MIDLSIVVPSYENAALLGACLGAVERARAAHPELRCEVIVVDNGSRDASVAVARATSPDVRVIALERNRGFAAAVNEGLRARAGRHALLLNSDAVIDEGLLARGVLLLDRRPEIGVLGAALRHPDGRPQRSVHALPDWTSELLPDRALRALRRVRGHGSRSRARQCAVDGAARAEEGAQPFAAECEEVEAVRGAVFFVSQAALATVGPLDAGYFFFLEETDYCFRVREAGLRVVHCTALSAVHQLGASSKARAPLATRIEYERALDRFLRLRRGPGTARWTRRLRLLRLVAGLPLLALTAGLGARRRARLRERVGLLLWHLRGRPAEPVLADALADALKAATGREGTSI